jgi:hypothetical protein
MIVGGGAIKGIITSVWWLRTDEVALRGALKFWKLTELNSRERWICELLSEIFCRGQCRVVVMRDETALKQGMVANASTAKEMVWRWASWSRNDATSVVDRHPCRSSIAEVVAIIDRYDANRRYENCNSDVISTTSITRRNHLYEVKGDLLLMK